VCIFNVAQLKPIEKNKKKPKKEQSNSKNKDKTGKGQYWKLINSRSASGNHQWQRATAIANKTEIRNLSSISFAQSLVAVS